MVKNIALVILIGLVVGTLAELIRSMPDPDLWSRSSSSVIVGVVAGAIAAVVVTSRNDKT